jgi:tRNA modification GTPase
MIFALSTPPGVSAIAVIRTSGEGCIEAVSGCLDKKPIKKNLAFVTNFVASGLVVDRVIVTPFFAPHSFTGEDMLEISCHGSPLVISQIFSALEVLGLREAGPGEFSERAFVNGKIALNEAESISDLIHATSLEEANLIANSFAGTLQGSLLGLGDKIDGLRFSVEASIDFADEDLDLGGLHQLKNSLSNLLIDVNAFIGSCYVVNSKKKEKRVLLVGPPNSGKSSLFNKLVGFDRAIVSDTPGTTRDLLEQQVLFGGMSFELIDSAGIRNSNDKIEQQGIKMIGDFANNSDVLILLFSTEELIDLDGFIETLDFDGKTLKVLNKIDISDSVDKKIQGYDYLISVKTGEGLPEFINGLRGVLGSGESVQKNASFSIRERHMTSLLALKENLKTAIEHCVLGSEEILAENLKLARSNIDFILGKKYTEDLLGDIFNNFCVGK